MSGEAKMNFWEIGDGNVQFFGAPQGWRCPVCGNVYSPTMPFCTFCAGRDSSYKTDTTAIPSEDMKRSMPMLSPYVVSARPQVALEEIIAPIKEKIEQLISDEEPETEEIRMRKEAYDLAIEDVIEIIEEETEDRTIEIRIPSPLTPQKEKK